MPMPLFDLLGPIGLGSKGILMQLTRIGAEPQGAAHLGKLITDLHLVGAVIKPLFHQIDDRMLGFTIKLGAVGIGHPGDVAGKLHHRQLHAETDTEKRHLVLASKGDGHDLALHTAVAEPSRHQNAVASFNWSVPFSSISSALT